MDVEIRPCLEKDLPELFNVFREIYAYNPNMVKRSYFDWLYKDTPFSDKKCYDFYLFCESNTIKAFAGGLPIEYRFDGKIQRGCWLWNWYTLKRGCYGISIWEYLKGKFGTVFVSGITDDAMRIYKAKNIPTIERTSRWMGVLNKGLCQSIIGESEEFWQRFPQVLTLPSKEVSFVDRFDDREEFFLEELSVRGYCRRTGAFLNWRFKDIPDHNYQIIRSDKQYGVFRVEKIKGYDQAVTRIIEWTFDTRLSQEALGLICEASRLENSIMMDFFSTAQGPGWFLEQCGFLAEKDVGFNIPRLFRPLKLASGISFGIASSPGSLSDWKFTDWYITNADNDSERIKL